MARFDTQLLDSRREFSKERMTELARRLQGLREIQRLPELCVYATGSYARQEAGEHSDIDLFFVHEGSSRDRRVSRLDELRLFARVIDIGEDMGFPTFSNDGEYLEILYIDDVLSKLGGREDDYHNYFTARMLLLLESAPLVGESIYRQMIDDIVEAYFRDYPDHSLNFRPVFLINDTIRFWKTLCLNYEHRRNKPEGDKDRRRRQQVKNFKLKFSRLMTCFGTVVAVCAVPSPIEKEMISSLASSVPLDRFLAATEGDAGLDELCSEVLEDYQWFMERTALSTGDLRALFESKEDKQEMFSRAEKFGERVYGVLAHFAEKNDYHRFLVV